VRVWDSTTGEQSAILTVNEAVAQADKDLATLGGYDARLRSAQFSPDGARVFITSGNGAVLVWDVMPKDAGPPPEWFRDFLRYMAQARLNSDGELETLKTADWLALQERLRGVLRASPNADTPYLHVLRKYVRE
jgi:WD40 repeat protein